MSLDVVTVTFQPIYSLKSNEIAFNNNGTIQVFNCNACLENFPICCNVSNQFTEKCYTCSCQNKGNNRCSLSPFCELGCTGRVGGGCPCSGRDTNPTVFLAAINQDMSCSSALSLASNPNQRVLNISSIVTVCDIQKRLLCCQGDSSLNPTLCQGFWGPNNQGKCDTIILNYCAINPTDPRCICINSTIPVPQCNDQRCIDTNAMKLSNMMIPCSGITINCTQILDLSKDAQQNVVKNVLQQLNCNIDITTSTTTTPVTGTPESTVGTATIVGIIVALDVLIFFIVLGVLFSIQMGPSQRGKNASKNAKTAISQLKRSTPKSIRKLK